MDIIFSLISSCNIALILFKVFLIYSILKVHGPTFQNQFILFHLKNHLSKVINAKFELNSQAVWIYSVQSNFSDLQLPVSYCASLIMVIIIRYVNVFINIFQTENISAVKFGTGFEKNISFLVISKISKCLEKILSAFLLIGLPELGIYCALHNL